jgi:outer membrane protein assembly factor BamE (lipoprotein component of BamABCDE complex)
MKIYIILLILLLFTSNCSFNKVEKRHGVPFLEKKNKELTVNKSNKNDIINLIGYPSTKSYFDNDIWIYIENKSTKSSLIKFGKTKYTENNVLVLEINSRGLLEKKKFYNIDDVNNIKYSEKATQSTDKDSFVYGFLSSVKQKIDSPKKKRSKKQ